MVTSLRTGADVANPPHSAGLTVGLHLDPEDNRRRERRIPRRENNTGGREGLDMIIEEDIDKETQHEDLRDFHDDDFQSSKGED